MLRSVLAAAVLAAGGLAADDKKPIDKFAELKAPELAEEKKDD